MPLHPEHDTIQAYLDDSLSSQVRQAFEQRLLVEPSLADAVIFLAREESIATEWVASTAAAEACRSHEPHRAEPSRNGKADRRDRRTWMTRAAMLAATAAALAIVLVLATGRGRKPNEMSPEGAVATLEEIHGTVDIVAADGLTEPAHEGQILFFGQEVRTGDGGSSTTLRVPDGRLVLASDTRIRMGPDLPFGGVAGSIFYVLEGLVGAEFSGRADGRPMILSSSLAELHGQQGKYHFASLPDGTFIEANVGSARVTRKTDGKSIVLPQGHSTVASADSASFQSKNLANRTTRARTQWTETGPVSGLQFDPESRFVMGAVGDALKRWDIATGKAVMTARPQKKKPIRHLALTPDAQFCAMNFGEDRVVRLYEGDAAVERNSFKGMKRVAATAFSPDNRHLAVSWNGGKEGHELRLYDTALGFDRVLQTGHIGPVQGMTFSPKGKFFATAADRSVRIWDAESFTLVRTMARMVNEGRVLAFSSDDRLLAIGDRKGVIRVVDPQTGSERIQFMGHLREITSLSFAPDHQSLLSSSADGTARLWDLKTGQQITTFSAHSNSVNSAVFSRDGRAIATGGLDRKIMIWDRPE